MQHLPLASATFGLLALLCLASNAAAITVPKDFVVEDAFPGTAFNRPTSFAFTPDGRVFIAERRGVVRVVKDGCKLPEPMWDAQVEVLNRGDRGLLGITVDPDFAVNRWVYLIYSVDPDSNGNDFDDDAFGRITRYQTSEADPDVFDLSTREVLVGRTWREGFPSGSQSHAIGSLQWGSDGSLFASCGDGAQYSYADFGGNDPEMFAPGCVDSNQDIGAFRAQSLESMAGKVLRINPATGYGYTSNPYFDGDVRSIRSRVWAYGLRNPFRFSFRPGTGSADTSRADPGVMAIIDVGWNAWEEVNMATAPGQNFGWPCYEGPEPQTLYQAAVSLPVNCDNSGTPGNPAWPQQPTIAWHHTDPTRSTPPGLVGRCGGAGTFYTGTSYPEMYAGLYFFSDFVHNWISVAAFDANHELVAVTTFAEKSEGSVDFVPHPITGEIHFLAYRTGRFYLIRYAPALAVDEARTKVALSNAYPNPSAASVSMTLESPVPQSVAFSVHDPAGREVWRSPAHRLPAGRSVLSWNGETNRGTRARPGLYFARVNAGASNAVRRFVILR